MRTPVLTVVLLLFSFISFSQVEINKSSLAPLGGAVTTGNSTVFYAVGELTVRETKQNGILLSEGFVGPGIKAVATKIKDYSLMEAFKAYPNPVSTDLFIDLPEESSYDILLFNVKGEEVLSEKFNGKNAKINMSGLKPAVYLLLVIDKNNKKKGVVKVEKR
jgi:hypothetical protein